MFRIFGGGSCCRSPPELWGSLYIFRRLGDDGLRRGSRRVGQRSKYRSWGCLRFRARMLSYECRWAFPRGIFMVFESVRLSHIVMEQGGLLFGVLPNGGLRPAGGFILFLTASSRRRTATPFDCRKGIGAGRGYHTEYGSFKFSMFMMGSTYHMVGPVRRHPSDPFLRPLAVPYLADTGFVLPWVGRLELRRSWSSLMRTGVDLPEIALLHLAIRLGPLDDSPVPVRQVMRLGWSDAPLSIANILVTGLVLLLSWTGRGESGNDHGDRP